MGEIITLNFKYTEKEYVAASWLYQRRSNGFMLRLVFFLLLTMGVLILMLSLGSDILLSLIFVILIPYLFLSLLLSTRPRQRFRGDPRFKDEYLLQFSDDGILFKSAQIEALVQWSLYSKVIENDRFYLLVQGQDMISVIPKRAFTSADQEAAFGELLKRKFSTYPKSLGTNQANESEKPYVPPTEPPDWR